MTDKDELKEVEYYAVQANAWVSTRMERDKSLLTLSAGGVGLLVTLLTAKGVESIYALCLYALAIVSFIICLGFLIAIFTLNSGYIEKMIQGNAGRNKYLRTFDHIALGSFTVGVILSLIIGLSTGIESLTNKRQTVLSKEKIEKVVGTRDINKSVNGVMSIELQHTQKVPRQTSRGESERRSPKSSSENK